MTEDKLNKKIKKTLYGKPQTAKVIFPAGFGEVALAEINSIMSSLWFPNKYSSQCELLKNEIRINHVHLFAITELLMRSQCLTDIRLIIYEGKTFGNITFEKKCREIAWDFYLNKTMTVKVHVNSIASRAFHETGLKETLSHILTEYADEAVSGENSTQTTTVYADLYKNKLTLSISLCGNLLYKRGYRTNFNANAPLREDIAACCIKQSLQFAKLYCDPWVPQQVIIPFSGTGTFAFEYLQLFYQLSPVLFGREYALEKMPFFKVDNFNYLLKKARENCLFEKFLFDKTHSLSIHCIDSAEKANSDLISNLENFNHALVKNNFPLKNESLTKISQADFFQIDLQSTISVDKSIFMLLNPPYGIRLGKSVNLYKNIAQKINDMAGLIKNKNIMGFILCPTEETWSEFSKHLHRMKSATYHFNQGGIDVRICHFYL